MRRFNAELRHNIRWVFFYFGFVAVCFILNGLRLDKTISVRLYGVLRKTEGLVWHFHGSPLKVPPKEWHKTFL